MKSVRKILSILITLSMLSQNLILPLYAAENEYYSEPISGTFHFTGPLEDLEYGFKYNDEWLFDDKHEYDLLKTSVRISVAAYGCRSEGDVNDFWSADNIVEMMDAMSFSYEPESVYFPTPENDSIGYAIGQKNVILKNGEKATVILAAVRGGGYGAEWGGDFRVGSQGDHEGFRIAADKVEAAIESYLSEHFVNDNFRIWLTGYSRGAATANLVAARLSRGEVAGVASENVKAYCFECPQNTIDKNASSAVYDNIINIVNPADFVTKVAMNIWGFNRYGRTYYMPSHANSGSYMEKWKKMAQRYKKLLRENDIKNNKQLYTLSPLQSTIPDVLFHKVSMMFSRNVYAQEYQNSLMSLVASAFGGSGEADWYDVTVSLCLLIGFSDKNPITTEYVTGLFDEGGGKYGHYAELCLSWVDSFGSMDNLRNAGNTVYRVIYGDSPMDMAAYDSDGKIVGQIINNEAVMTEGGLPVWFDDDGTKIIAIPPDSEYNVEITATEDEAISIYEMEYDYDSGRINRLLDFSRIEVREGEVLSVPFDDITDNQDDEYMMIKDDEVIYPNNDLSGRRKRGARETVLLP